jgi:hypothetical protein
MVTVAGALAASVHPAGRVTVTTWPAVVPVFAVQVPANPEAKVTAGEVGSVNALLNVAEMVLPAARAPVAEGVNPTVQVETAVAVATAGEKVTPVGVLATALITTAVAGWAAAGSLEVATPKALAG